MSGLACSIGGEVEALRLVQAPAGSETKPLESDTAITSECDVVGNCGPVGKYRTAVVTVDGDVYMWEGWSKAMESSANFKANGIAKNFDTIEPERSALPNLAVSVRHIIVLHPVTLLAQHSTPSTCHQFFSRSPSACPIGAAVQMNRPMCCGSSLPLRC
jgi:hypothetical protein